MPWEPCHTPHMPTAEREKQFADVKDPTRRKCLAQISLLDDAIGEVTRALAASGQTQDTLIFFFSDNGGTPPSLGADNTPLYFRINPKARFHDGSPVQAADVVLEQGSIEIGCEYCGQRYVFDEDDVNRLFNFDVMAAVREARH